MKTLLDTALARRALLVTGKGGVGKSLVAAALARMLAQRGRRVLCAELATDVDHPSRLGELFGRRLVGEEPVPVEPNLRLTLLTPTAGHRRFLQDVLPAKLLANAALRSGAIRRFLAAAPSFNELGALYRLLDYSKHRRPDGSVEYQHLVVDLPATGHALALAQIPALVNRVLPTGPIGQATREGLELLGDPEQTAALVVTLVEPLPITESLELVKGMTRHHIPFAGVIANRVLRETLTPEEHDLLAAALAGKGPLLGSRLYAQGERTRALLGQLSQALPHPTVLLDELPARGPELLAEAVAELSVARWRLPGADA